MTPAEFATRVGAKRNGDWWQAHCPAHEDGTPSLSITVGRHGRTLLHCHAGCPPEQILAALGLEMRDLFADNGHGSRDIAATYPYTDEQGVVLYQVVRFAPKDFRARRPDVNGGWIWNLNGTRRVLYRLPELMSAIAAGERVFVVEGEKDAEAVRRAGFAATCNPGGAGKWRPEYGVVLKGADVVIVADKDEPGYAHARAVAARLRGSAAKVVVVEPAVGKDVSDHLAAGKTLRDLVPVADEPPAPPVTNVRGAGGDERRNGPGDSEESGEVFAVSWEPPIPFDFGDLPPFPVTALPDWLRAFAEAESHALQTPPDLAALLGLGAVAVSVHGKIEVEVKSGYREPLNLYIAPVLPPGTRKTPVFRAALQPLVEWERDEAQRQKTSVLQGQQARRLIEKRLERAEQDVARATISAKRHAGENEARGLVAQLATTPMPVFPRLWCDDTTAEGLAKLLAEHGGRMAVFAPEGGSVFAIMSGRYSQGSNFEIYLKGWSGEPHRVDRRHGDGFDIVKTTLTLVLSLQPAVLAGLLRDRDRAGFRGQGLLARFLFVVPHSPLGRREVDPHQVTADVERMYGVNLRELLAIELATDGAGAVVPHLLSLSPEAYARRVAFDRALEPRLGETGDLHPVADWAAKLSGTAIRIAGLLHCARERGQPWATRIPDSTMAAALTIADYLLSHAVAAFRAMHAEAAVVEAEFLLRHLRQRAQPEVSKRDLFQWTKGHFDQVDELEPALRVLVNHNYLQPLPSQRHEGAGRPPSPRYAVNPAILRKPSSKSSEFGAHGKI